MSRNRRAPGSILLVTLGAAAGWVGAPVGVAVLMAQTSFGTSQPKSQTSMQKVKPSPGLQKAQPSQKQIQFSQMKSRAMSGKPPGGNPSGESNAFMERLKRQHESRVESQNARVQAMFGRLSVPPTGGGGKKGPPPGVHAPGTGPAPMKLPDPCEGRPLEVKAIQTSPPLEPGDKVFIDGCGFGYPTDPAPAEVLLLGDGFPGGRQKLIVEGCLPSGILARVPPIHGVLDFPAARLQVVRGSQFSAMVDVGGFRATREVRRLTPADVDVSCSEQTPGCRLATSPWQMAASGAPPPVPPSGESQFFAGATFAAKHLLDLRPSIPACEHLEDVSLGRGSKTATDTYRVGPLRNGWLLVSYNWWWKPENDGWVMPPAKFNPDTNSSSIEMKWGVQASACEGPVASDVRYRVDLYIVGPKGIPYK